MGQNWAGAHQQVRRGGDALPFVLDGRSVGKAPKEKRNMKPPPTPIGVPLDPESPHTWALWHRSS